MIAIRIGRRVFKIYARTIPLSDAVGFAYHTAYMGGNAWFMHSFHRQTLTVDLTVPEDEIIKGFKSNTRNEIRKAERENYTFASSDIGEFVPLYNAFAQGKGLAVITEEELSRYPKMVIFKSGLGDSTYAMHASLLDDDNRIVRLLYSCSVRLDSGVETKYVGIANRFLHYSELMEFKRMGYETYDFAGINQNPENKEQYRITQFKLCFGGQIRDVRFLTSYPAFLYDTLSCWTKKILRSASAFIAMLGSGSLFRKIKGKIHVFTHRETGAIWILHRVYEKADDDFFPENRALSLSAAALESEIEKYLSAGYAFVSLDEACRIQSSGCGKKKFACITFDDGYADNFTVAYPILKRRGIPFTIYVTTSFIQRSAPLWWYWIEELHRRDSRTQFGPLHDRFQNMKPEDLKAYLNETYPDFGQWNSEMLDSIALSLDQLKMLASDPLCTIGLHTVSHCRLDVLDPQEQKYELEEGKKILESLVGRSVLHVSYPYGAYNSVTEEICRKAGFSSAVGAWGGVMRRKEPMISAKRVKIFDPE